MPLSDPGDYAIAFNFRQLVLWFGAQLVVGLASLVFGMVGSTMTVMATIVTLAALAYYAYRTAEALGSTAAGLWGVAMLVPCANVITLLLLNSKATAACRARGIRVGLLGPEV